MWSFTRKLFGDLAVDVLISDRVLQDVTVTTGSNSSSEPSSTGFDQVVLCSVSAIWICLIVLVVIWFCKCNGSEHLNNWTSYLASRASDQQYTSGILRRQAEAADARKVTPEKQRELLRQTWERNQVIMVIEETDLVSGTTTNENDPENGAMGDSDDGITHLALRLAHAEHRLVPNCCAVCLCSYDVGESVVWSNDCQHCFHQDCVSDWLIKMQDGLPCPCCRQKFVELEETRKNEAKISWAAGPTMDISVIRL